MNWLKIWADHGSKILGAGLGTVAAIALKYPGILTDVFGPNGATIGMLITAAAALLHGVTHKAAAAIASSSAGPPHGGGSGSSTAKMLALAVLLAPLVMLGGGCSTLAAIVSNPAVISDITAGLAAIVQAAGGSESQLNSQATTALATAQGTELTLTELASAVSSIPGLSSAVNQYVTENPSLASTEATLNAWLSALAEATTPGTAAQASAQAKLAVRRAAIRARASPATASLEAVRDRTSPYLARAAAP